MTCEWHDKIFSVTDNSFDELALEIFQFQYSANPVYHSYVDAIGKKPADIHRIEQIPFLPISFFKTDRIISGEFNPEAIFESSGTTQTKNSHHYVKNLALYLESCRRTFESFYGKINEWCILGLLPSYLERDHSSLVYMVSDMIRQSRHDKSGFYLYDLEKLKDTLLELERSRQKTLLIGVTYALLDFAEKFPGDSNHHQPGFTTIMETGGMKGRREEITRMEVHERLKRAFLKNEIHSEYGMTELLSQAYSKENGKFQSPPWMKILIRDDEDPLSIESDESMVTGKKPGVSGAINIIDLANVYSCSFIATDDVGKLYADRSFEVLGRMDGTDLRGCSLLMV